MFKNMHDMQMAYVLMATEPQYESSHYDMFLAHGSATRSMIRRLDYETRLFAFDELKLPPTPRSQLKVLERPDRLLHRSRSGDEVVWPFTAPEITVPPDPPEQELGVARVAFRKPFQQIEEMSGSAREAVWRAFRERFPATERCRFRLLQFLAAAGGFDWAISTVATDSQSPTFSTKEIAAVKLATAFEDEWKWRREAYAALVNTLNLPVAAGNMGAIEHERLEYFKGGIKVPKRLRQHFYVMKLLSDRRSTPKSLDFHSVKYNPLFTVPIRMIALPR
jgi:hypothetical protein